MKRILTYASLIGTLLGTSPSEATETIAKRQFDVDGKPVFITYESEGCGCDVTARIEVYAQGARGLLCQPEQTYVCEGAFDSNGYFKPKACNGIPPPSVLEKLVRRVQ